MVAHEKNEMNEDVEIERSNTTNKKNEYKNESETDRHRQLHQDQEREMQVAKNMNFKRMRSTVDGIEKSFKRKVIKTRKIKSIQRGNTASLDENVEKGNTQIRPVRNLNDDNRTTTIDRKLKLNRSNNYTNSNININNNNNQNNTNNSSVVENGMENGRWLQFPQALLTATVLASHNVLPLVDVEATMNASNTISVGNSALPSMSTTTTAIAAATTTTFNAITNKSSSYDEPFWHYNYNNNSHNNNSGNIDTSDMLRTFEEVSNLITFYYVPILVITGTIGNVLSIVVFTTTKLRKVSSSYYLSALAISDTCFLFGLFTQWLNFIDIDLYNREFFCQFFTYFSNLANFCSVWFVVAFTVERFIAVIYPLRRQTMCTVKRAKLVLITLTAIGCVHCIPFWISSTPVYSERVGNVICDIKEDYKEYITVLNYWDTVVVYAVPFAAIVILNAFTGCSVWKFANVRRTLTMQRRKSPDSPTYRMSSLSLKTSSFRHRQRQRPQSTGSSNEEDCIEQQSTSNVVPRLSCCNLQKTEKRKSANSSQAKVTKMLLIVSTVFVLFNLPSCVLRIKTFLETQTSSTEQATVVLQYIFQLLFITNFGINFILYCLSGQNFRKAIIAMFRRVSPKKREGNTQVTVSEYWRNSGLTGLPSTRRRLMTQRCWNEMHELHPLK